ncbi:MAG: copper chaperone PCu(A)C [Gammaproteobacteria bacterium]|nr:copper chaperone PCu(A)C [Gammaproteobacteria bacterium]
MKTLLRHLTLTTTLLASGAAFAQSHDGMHAMASDAIQVEQPYVRAVPPGQPNSAAFMTLRNHSDKANAVVAASSPAARVVELHTHIMDNGMMKMRQIKQIELPAKGEAVLQPGGLHIMLIGLQQQLTPGMNVALTLKFADGSMQEINAPVQAVTQSMGHQPATHHPMQH